MPFSLQPRRLAGDVDPSLADQDALDLFEVSRCEFYITTYIASCMLLIRHLLKHKNIYAKTVSI